MADEKAKIVLTAVDQTKAAFNSAKKNFESLQSAGDSLLLKFGSIGVALTAAFEGISIKSVIDAADELSKLSQKTGIAIEDLSALKFAGDLSNVSIEDLGTGLKKLAVNMAAAAGGSKEAAAAFDAIGVKVNGAGGGLRATDDVLGDIADKFASYKDGAAKAALATELFGKGGAALIPFLNAGRAGLKEMKEEAEKLGIVIGGQLGKDAEAFNDNLTRLGAAAQGAKLAIASDLLPALLDLTNQFIDARKAYGGFVAGFVDVLNGSTVAGGLEKTRAEIGKLKDDLADLEKRQASPNLGDKLNTVLTGNTNQKLKEQIGLLEKRAAFQKAQQAREALAAGKDITDTNARLRGPAQVQAPIVHKPDPSAAAAALAALKANLSAELDAIKTSLSAQQDLYKFNETYVQALYQTGNTSLKAFFDTQDALRDADLASRKKALNDSIAAEEQFQKALPAGKSADLIDSQKKVTAARAALAKADQDAVQQTAVTSLTRQKQIDDQKRALDVFNGQLADLVTGARDRAAELAEIAVKVDAAKDKLIQSGVDRGDANSQAEQLRAQLLAQRDFNLARDEFTRITDKARDAEEALVLVQQKNGVGLLEGEKQVTAIREQELQQLGKALEATRALAAQNPLNATFQTDLRNAELAYGRLAATADATKQRLDAAADSLGGGIAETLGRAVTEGGKLKDILNDVLKQIATSISQEAIVKPLAAQFSNFIKGSGGQGAGENLIGLLTGQNKKSPADASKLPGALSDGKDATAGVTDSLTNLKTVGVDPMTAALTNLTQAINATSAALGKPAGDGDALTIDTKGIGIDANTHNFSAAKDGPANSGEQSIADLFKDNGAQQAADANKDSAAASKLAANALVQLGSGASVANTALSLVPSIVSAISAAASSSSASGSGGGLLGVLGGLFGSKGGENVGGTTGGGTFSAASTYSEGGFTGNFGRKTPVGVVEGQEFVFSAPAVTALGVSHLDNMHRAARAGRVPRYEQGGYVGQMPSGRNGGQQWSRPPPVININQTFAAGTTQKTADQAAGSAAREASRYLGRGGG